MEMYVKKYIKKTKTFYNLDDNLFILWYHIIIKNFSGHMFPLGGFRHSLELFNKFKCSIKFLATSTSCLKFKANRSN